LLSSGADINLCDEAGQSPLFVATKHGHCDLLKCLLSSGADINLRDEGGRSPLIVASKRVPELSKHLTTSQCPSSDATNNGDCPPSSRKLISAPELHCL
jgi:ankyrin repeat protein